MGEMSSILYSILGLYRVVYWGYKRIMEKRMETTICLRFGFANWARRVTLM